MINSRKKTKKTSNPSAAIARQQALLNQQFPVYMHTTKTEEQRFLQGRNPVQLQKNIENRRLEFYRNKCRVTLLVWESSVKELQRFMILDLKYNQDKSLNAQNPILSEYIRATFTVINTLKQQFAKDAHNPAMGAYVRLDDDHTTTSETKREETKDIATLPPSATTANPRVAGGLTREEACDDLFERRAIAVPSTISLLTKLIRPENGSSSPSNIGEQKTTDTAAPVTHTPQGDMAHALIQAPDENLASSVKTVIHIIHSGSPSSSGDLNLTAVGSPAELTTVPLAHVKSIVDLTTHTTTVGAVLPDDLKGSNLDLPGLEANTDAAAPRPGSAPIDIHTHLPTDSIPPPTLVTNMSPTSPENTSAVVGKTPAAVTTAAQTTGTTAKKSETKGLWTSLFGCCSSGAKKPESTMERRPSEVTTPTPQIM